MGVTSVQLLPVRIGREDAVRIPGPRRQGGASAGSDVNDLVLPTGAVRASAGPSRWTYRMSSAGS